MKHSCMALVVAFAAALASAGDPAKPETKSPAISNEAAQEEPPAPAAEEVAGKVDALTEALTELKNVVEALAKMKMSGYVQAQYVHDESSVDALSSATATRNRDQFSVRRARVKFTHQFGPNAKVVWAPDVSSSRAVLKDAWIEYSEPWTTWRHTLSAGQFNWPFGFEIGYSSSDREMPERSRVVRTLFPGERDRGVMMSGAGFQERFKYNVAIVNGTGTAQSFDFNKRKDLVGRVGGTFGPLDLGVSIYRGADLVATSAVPTGVEFAKQREGIDFQLVTPVEGLGIRGEYITGKQPPASGASGAAAKTADVKGWYLYAIQNLGTKNQFVARVDRYDPNDGGKLPATPLLAKVTTWGGSYIFHWDANSKVMLAYEHPDTDVANDPDDDLVTLRYQYKF